VAVINKIQELQDKKNEYLSLLESMPYSKVDDYIDNITDLKSAKEFLRKLTKVVLYLVKDIGE